MIGYDIDGVLHGAGRGIPIPEPPYVVISGRTWAEYDATARELAQRSPVYIRGAGLYGDREDAGRFKAMMIRALGVHTFYEDDELQAAIIREHNPFVNVVVVA